MLLGTADEVLAKPKEEVKFMEDMAPEGMAALMAAGLPFGFGNLGNTCYMNSTLHVLKTAQEFSETVKSAASVSDPLVRETQNVFKKMESATDVIEPHAFWERLKQRKPGDWIKNSCLLYRSRLSVGHSFWLVTAVHDIVC